MTTATKDASAQGSLVIVTGGASGIGLATAVIGGANDDRAVDVPVREFDEYLLTHAW